MTDEPRAMVQQLGAVGERVRVDRGIRAEWATVLALDPEGGTVRTDGGEVLLVKPELLCEHGSSDPVFLNLDELGTCSSCGAEYRRVIG
jgi:hypothetical protein